MGFRKSEYKVRLNKAPGIFFEAIREVVEDDLGVNRVSWKHLTSEEIIERNLSCDDVNPHSLISHGESIPIPPRYNSDTTDAADVSDMAAQVAQQQLDKNKDLTAKEVNEEVKETD